MYKRQVMELWGVLSSGYLDSPKFSVPPSGEIVRQTPNSFKDVRTCSKSSITMPNLAGLGLPPAAGAAKNVQFFGLSIYRPMFVTLSVCSSRI